MVLYAFPTAFHSVMQNIPILPCSYAYWANASETKVRVPSVPNLELVNVRDKDLFADLNLLGSPKNIAVFFVIPPQLRI